MRVLLTTFWNFPHVGGVCQHIKTLKRELERVGHQVHILARNEDESGYHLLPQGRIIHRGPIDRLAREKLTPLLRERMIGIDPYVMEQEVNRCAFELAALSIGVDHYDVIHAHDIISARAIERIKPPHIPLVVSVHGCIATEHLTLTGSTLAPGSDIWEYIQAREQIGVNAGDLTIVPSKWLRDLHLREYQVPSARLEVIPYGLDCSVFYRQMKNRAEVTREPGKHVLICPARLDVVKGHQDLLDALSLLQQERSDWVCWIVGDGYLREYLEAQLKRLKLSEHVQFLGSRDHVPALLAQADIFVLSSRQDTLPIAVMEAQLAGLPVVATDAGGIPEMVTDQEDGLLSPAGDSRSLFKNLHALLADRELRNRMRKNAKRWASVKWSAKKMVQSVVAAYRSAIRAKKEQPHATLVADEGTMIPIPAHYSPVDLYTIQPFPRKNHLFLKRGRKMSSVKIGILGSCVTRDTFEYLPAHYFQIDPVFSRTSLISLMTPPIPLSYQDINLASEWQKRMVLFDFQKKLWEVLATQSVDLLIVDFIDERFDLLFQDGSYVTRSHELAESGIESSGKYQFQLIPRFDPVTRQTWKWFCEMFIYKLEHYLPPEKIILHMAPWMTHYRSGSEVLPFEFPEWIASNNTELEEYYQHFTRIWKGVHTLDLRGKGFVSDANHRWGLQPYHYEDAYYRAAGEQIMRIAGLL